MNAEQLKNIGGSEWIRGNNHRIYFNKLAQYVGLEYSTYNTGSISGATFRGQKISNTKARSLRTTLDLGKLYYDVNTGQWVSQGLGDWADEIIKNIESRIN